MADVDNYIMSLTNDFTRYVDDIRIFTKDRATALIILHRLTEYLYTSHRLVLSGSKTKIKETDEFMKQDLINEEKEESIAKMKKQEEITFDNIDFASLPFDPYDDSVAADAFTEEFERLYNDIGCEREFEILCDTYSELFDRAIA